MMSSAIALSLLLSRARQDPIVTPYAKTEKLAIREVKLSSDELPRLGLEEIEVDAHGRFDNPFDPRDVALDGHFVGPSGKTIDVPGFYYRPFERKLEGGNEVLTPTGAGKWIIRFAPQEEGTYQATVTFRDRTGIASTNPKQFKVTAETSPGMIRVSPRDHRYFEYDDGKAFYPVATNACWGLGGGTFDYDDWLPNFGKQGVNMARLWLSPAWTTFALEKVGKPEEGKGLGQIDLADAWRLDHVAGLAKKEGINLQLCIESFNILRDQDDGAFWEKTPHNSENGGPLRVWKEFWTNLEVDRTYKAKLRYLVARYGAYSNLFAWEFWNEVDLVRDFDTEKVRDWHRRMATELRSIDPYQHPITTSLSNSMGSRDIELIPELDFFQTHHYGSPDLAGTVVMQQSRKAWGRPHLIGEIGADTGGPRVADDPLGMQIHDPQWASIACGVSGTASPWWWDNYIVPKNLYPLFGSVARFVKGIDWPGEAFQIANLSFAYQVKPAKPVRTDLVFENGPVTFTPSEANQPKTIAVSSSGATGALPLSGVQQGVRNHPELHNPILFKVDLPRPTRFEAIVTDVSGWGGATLQVELDGDRVLTRDFADPDDMTKTDSLAGKYAGRYGFTVPAGTHVLKVENGGKDWFMATYRFAELVTRSSPNIQGWAVVGNDTVLGWFRPIGRTWSRVCALKEAVPPVPPTYLDLAGLDAGAWIVEYWNTWKGEVTSSRQVIVGNSGKARVPLPGFSTDLAIKMRKVR